MESDDNIARRFRFWYSLRMLLGHIYGIITLLAIVTGSVTLTLGILSYLKSGERYLRFFLLFLGVFNLKFLLEFFKAYIVLNISPYPDWFFTASFIGSGIIDCTYLFFLIPMYGSLFNLKPPVRFLVVGAVIMVTGFVLVYFSGTYAPGGQSYRPGIPAGIGNSLGILLFTGIVLFGVLNAGRVNEARQRFFLFVSLACSFLATVQALVNFIFILGTYPDIELRLPRPEKITFPWLSLYFGLYMAVIIYFFIKFYLVTPMTSEKRELSLPSYAVEAAVGRYGLSAREREILKLMLEGFRNDEIGSKLFISTGTVKTHLHNIYRKTGTESRTRLFRLLLG